MEFEKVREEQILQGIKDYKEKGLPKEFGPSSTYDLVFEGELYPPKAIMAYANFHASGKEITAYFKGGQGTDCFNALEREGFVVVQKANKLLNAYLKEFALIADDWFERQDWFQDTFDFYTDFFKEDNLKNAEWVNFQELGNYIHAFKSMAIAKGNALGKPNLPIEEYQRIFSYIVSEEDPINITINNLYKKYEGNAFLPYFSDSSISEIIAYAFPNKYVVYNRRDVKALEILGINVPKVRAEKFGDTFNRYNGILTSVLDQYKKIVGQRTNTTIQLELDQFFSWLYETKKADKPIKELIHRYKALIKNDGLDAERYKWEFVRDFKGKPDLNASLVDEVKAIKFGNLMYHLSVACLKDIANFDAVNLKKEFISIRNETIDLDQRIVDFNKNTLKIYKKSGGDKSHHQDERSMSVYLTLYDPSEYTFYKSSYYTKYCELLDVKVGKPKHKYSHYLELVKDLAEDYISKDQELVELLHTELGDLMEQDPSFLLVAQDILYQLVGNDRDEDYWIFQGNPKIYDFIGAMRKGGVDTWTVSGHKDKMKVGDKAIIWITGEDAGCYALGKITREPFLSSPEKDEFWKEEDKSEWKVGLEMTHSLVDNPITKEMQEGNELLSNLKVGNQGSTFSATKEEYEELLTMIGEQSNFLKCLGNFNSEDLKAYFKFLDEIIVKNDIQKGDDRICFAYGNDRLNLTVGQRYSWNLFTNEEQGKFGVLSQGELNETSESYAGNRPRPWYSYFNDFNPSEEEKKNIHDGISFEYNRAPKSGFRRHNKEDFENYVFERTNKKIMKDSINQILYGPPGTGKTYNTINKALEIIGQDISGMHRDEVVRVFESKVQEGQIAFTTFHQSFSYEDFIEGIKPVVELEDSSVEGELQYRIENGIFKDLVERINNAQEFVESDQKSIFIDPLKFKKNINKVSLGNSLDSNDDAIYDYCMENGCVAMGFGEEIDFSGVKSRIEIRKRFQDNGIEIKSSMDFNVSAIERFLLWMEPGQLVFVSDGMSKLKAIGEVSGEYFCDPSSPIRYAQFRKVKWLYKDLAMPIEEIYGKKFSQQTIYQIDSNQINQSFFSNKKTIKKDSSNYVLIIDEINRGNVSSIFGELITLIEPDKRKGEPEELSAILPYSKKRFSVPKNLHILGTMNTADRSVEALDTALRRRFSFEEILPKPSLLTNEPGGISMKELLTVMNERIEVLVDRDHTIGHAFFMNNNSLDDLRNTFANKVIPLLQEYFYGDYGKMEMVIGSAFFKVKYTSKVKFAVKSEDFDPEGKVYHIVDVADKKTMSDEAFKEALTKLIQGED